MKDRLVTPGYCFILAANFLLYFGFWLLIPVLPFYLSEIFNAGNSTIGIILSCYTVAALCIRPFSGYFLDSFARKPLYLLAYFIFMTMFAGYIIAGSLVLFILFRIIHGVSFGMVTVGGNTVVIDIMPSSRRGEGLGYYGLSNNIAMAVVTLVFRVSHRLGLVSDKCTTPFSVEKELVKHIPEAEIPIAHHWLILHGRYVCQARTPQCDNCGLQLMCKYYCRKYKVSKESNEGEE